MSDSMLLQTFCPSPTCLFLVAEFQALIFKGDDLQDVHWNQLETMATQPNRFVTAMWWKQVKTSLVHETPGEGKGKTIKHAIYTNMKKNSYNMLQPWLNARKHVGTHAEPHFFAAEIDIFPWTFQGRQVEPEDRARAPSEVPHLTSQKWEFTQTWLRRHGN